MQKTNFLFPFRGACTVPEKEEQPQIFLPLVPLVLLSLQRHISHPHGNGMRNTICLSAEDPLNKAAQSFWLLTTQAVTPGLPLGSELPLDTWTSSSQMFSFPEPHVFLFQKSHCRTESRSYFSCEAMGIPVCSLYHVST